MVDTVVEVKTPSEKELKAQLNDAVKSGDWKQIAKIAGEIDKFEKAKEQTAKEIRLKALEALTEEVKVAIQKAIKPIIDSKKLDSADGVWFTQDFGEKLVTCRLTKSAPRKAGTGGGGTGKVYDVSTGDLLAKFGKEVYKDGVTYQAAYDGNTDKNYRFTIRKSLLKLNGNK